MQSVAPDSGSWKISEEDFAYTVYQPRKVFGRSTVWHGFFLSSFLHSAVASLYLHSWIYHNFVLGVHSGENLASST